MRPNFSRIWRTLFLGQFLSILLCGTGITSQLLQDTYNLHLPTAQSFLNYVILCLIFTTWLAFKPGESNLFSVIRQRGWKYFLLAIVDVEANFLVVKAYQYTTITSIQLLDCFTIPTVLLLSWLWIKIQYGIVHILGVCLSLIGIGCLIYSDLDESTKGIEAKNRFLGDMLCICGATLYGVSNVSQEYVVKSYSIVEFLGMIGLFGSLVNGVQLWVLERDQVELLFHLDKLEEISLIFGFAACLLLLYITMPLVLQVSNATSVNISILSADFYALLIGLYLFNFKFNWLYFVSFALIIIGVTTFNLVPAPSKIDPNPSLDTIEVNSRTGLSPHGDGTSGGNSFDGRAATMEPRNSLLCENLPSAPVMMPNVLDYCSQSQSPALYNTFHQYPPASQTSHQNSQQPTIFKQESDLIASIEKSRQQAIDYQTGAGRCLPQPQQFKPPSRMDLQGRRSLQLIWEDQC